MKEEIELHEYRVYFHRERDGGTYEGYSFETARDCVEAESMFLSWVSEQSVADPDEYDVVKVEKQVAGEPPTTL